MHAVFEAFGNQSADVRKTVVFCLVDIYIMIGKAFLPYLEGLNSTQTNCKIGFMSFLMIASVLIIFLTVPEKVEADGQCIGRCGMIFDCATACIRMGYQSGQCVGWENPNQCCCDH
ncbi:unnamed protein product [Brassica oleracea var. botrytis]|nr:unnamed protein product [Brassica napus]